MPEFIEMSEVKHKLAQRPTMHEDVHPVREFAYKEDGDRRVTLSREGEEFVVDDPWAFAQLCRLIGYNTNIFAANDPDLNVTIMRERLPGVRAREHMVKWTEDADGHHLKAILSRNFSTIKDLDLAAIAADTLSGAKAATASLEGPTTSMKLVQGEEDKITVDGEDVWFGVNLSCSEVGSSKLIVDSLLFVPRCTNGMITSWGDSRYFTHNYRDARAEDLRDMYTNGMERFKREREKVAEILQKAAERKFSKPEIQELWDSISERRGVSRKFIKEISGSFEMSMADGEERSLWDVMQHVTEAAQTLTAEQRIRHEVFAGNFIGLNLETVEAE